MGAQSNHKSASDKLENSSFLSRKQKNKNYEFS